MFTPRQGPSPTPISEEAEPLHQFAIDVESGVPDETRGIPVGVTSDVPPLLRPVCLLERLSLMLATRKLTFIKKFL
jgi:hypothetical protein